MLSSLELRILGMLSEGMQSKEIAAAIGRSKPTVEGYIRILFAKFGAKSRAHLVANALRSGAIEHAATSHAG